MPQPTGRDLHVDTLLSNVSIGYMNEPSSYIADQAFPVILVNKQSGKIAHYTKDDWFRDEAEMRAPLTKSAGGGFRMETPLTYFADELDKPAHLKPSLNNGDFHQRLAA